MPDTGTTHEPSSQILLAEDHPVNQLVATAMLENLGFCVDVVVDGAQAVRAATSTPYRAILMDCQIPVLDGYQATGEIRRSQGAGPRTPIIAVTASDSEADQQRCLAAGMDDYLTKPLSLEALAVVMARWAPDGRNHSAAVDPVDVMSSMPVGLGHLADAVQPALDPQVIGRLERLGKAAGEDLMGQLAWMFLAEADAWVFALHGALDVHDAAAVNRSAHLLRGASANLGANDLARLCDDLAKVAGAGDLVDSIALVDAVEAELGRVRSALTSRTPLP